MITLISSLPVHVLSYVIEQTEFRSFASSEDRFVHQGC